MVDEGHLSEELALQYRDQAYAAARKPATPSSFANMTNSFANRNSSGVVLSVDENGEASMTNVAGHTVVEPADEIRSEKWRGVIFLKDGTHLLGERIFDSYEELAQTIEECSREWRECASQYPGKLYVVKGPVSGQRTFLCVDFSHVIPIPYKQP